LKIVHIALKSNFITFGSKLFFFSVKCQPDSTNMLCFDLYYFYWFIVIKTIDYFRHLFSGIFHVEDCCYCLENEFCNFWTKNVFLLCQPTCFVSVDILIRWLVVIRIIYYFRHLFPSTYTEKMKRPDGHTFVDIDVVSLFILFIFLFIHIFIYLFIYIFTFLLICSFINLLIYLFIHLFIHSFIYSFIYLFICLFIHS